MMKLHMGNAVIASEAKQSRVILRGPGLPRRFAPRNDGGEISL